MAKVDFSNLTGFATKPILRPVGFNRPTGIGLPFYKARKRLHSMQALFLRPHRHGVLARCVTASADGAGRRKARRSCRR